MEWESVGEKNRKNVGWDAGEGLSCYIEIVIDFVYWQG